MVDAHFAEFIDDNRDPAPVVRRQYSVQQCCLAGAQKTGQDGDRHSLVIPIRHGDQILLQLYFEKIAMGWS